MSDLLEIVPINCIYYNGYNLKLNLPLNPVKMSSYELDVIISGRAHLIIDNVSYMLYPGDICLRKPGQVNRHMIDTSYECLHFKFDVKNDSDADNFFDHLPTHITKEKCRDIRDAILTFHKNYYNESEYSVMVCRAMLIMIKAGLYKQLHPVNTNSATTYHTVIRRAIDFMTKNISTPISVEALAEYCGYSTKHFQKTFKDATGMAPHQYLLKLRIDRAKDLLATTAYPIKNISLQCGFVDSNYFANAFKRIVGVPPRQFRKELF